METLNILLPQLQYHIKMIYLMQSFNCIKFKQIPGNDKSIHCQITFRNKSLLIITFLCIVAFSCLTMFINIWQMQYKENKLFIYTRLLWSKHLTVFLMPVISLFDPPPITISYMSVSWLPKFSANKIWISAHAQT